MDATRMRSMLKWVTPVALLLTLCICLYVAFGERTQEDRYCELANVKKKTYSKSGTTIDYGNSDCGYFMIKQKAGKSRLKVKVSKGENSLNYDLNNQGEFEALPLQFGDGKYKIQVFRQVKGTQYSQVSSTSISVKLKEEDINYLYPNQYVWYEKGFDTVAKSFELCQGITSDKDKVQAVYDFAKTKISYDYILAMSVKSGYIPDVDEVLESKKGICFGYAAVMACMLRVQGIPAQLVIGYADKTYHAWNKILVDGEWVRYDATFASTGGKARTYTTERTY